MEWLLISNEVLSYNLPLSKIAMRIQYRYLNVGTREPAVHKTLVTIKPHVAGATANSCGAGAGAGLTSMIFPAPLVSGVDTVGMVGRNAFAIQPSAGWWQRSQGRIDAAMLSSKPS
jgi:hypothetical protein